MTTERVEEAVIRVEESYRQAINEALRQEMRRDPRVIIMGEDISGGTGTQGDQDAWGGPLGVTKGLRPEFGPEACSTRTSPRSPSSAPRPARRRPACAPSSN